MTATTPPTRTNRIRSVTIEGFRSLKNIQNLDLPPLTVLIGANGAGKSALIRFFEMLSWMLKAKNLQEFVLRHGGGDDQFFISCSVKASPRWSSSTAAWSLTCGPAASVPMELC